MPSRTTLALLALLMALKMFLFFYNSENYGVIVMFYLSHFTFTCLLHTLICCCCTLIRPAYIFCVFNCCDDRCVKGERSFY